MGWSESPPYFCSVTETGRDIIQTYYTKQPYIPPHPLEPHLETNILKAKIQQQPPNTTSIFEVYVDDLITATNNLTQKKHPTHF